MLFDLFQKEESFPCLIKDVLFHTLPSLPVFNPEFFCKLCLKVLCPNPISRSSVLRLLFSLRRILEVAKLATPTYLTWTTQKQTLCNKERDFNLNLN